ncbi:hypothetical protein D3C76_1694070 [compost metagenome]
MVPGVDEDVPVIAIIVNDLSAQTRELGLNRFFERINEPLQNCSFASVFHEMQA